jgi:50S ribosomal subunit-associated GTPase HflX
MMRVIQEWRKRVKVRIPQSEYSLVATAIREGTVHSKEYEGNDVVIDVELPIMYAEKLSSYIILE